MTEIGSPGVASRSSARSKRQRVRCPIGEVPTVSLNFWAKLDRDMPSAAQWRYARRCRSKLFHNEFISIHWSLALRGSSSTNRSTSTSEFIKDGDRR
jgi:hypothetical protein